MLKIEVSGLREAVDQIKDLSERRVRAAAATALTRTAVKVREKLKAELQGAIDRPTPYTQRQLRYAPATAQRLVAAVGFDIQAIQDVYGNTLRYEAAAPGTTPAGSYMRFQAEGGSRQSKRFERALQAVGVLPRGWLAVPGKLAKIDAYGNQSIGEIRQILSWFDAAELVAGSRQNMRQAGRDKRRKGTRKTAGFEYFAVQPGARRGGLKPGIYRRVRMALGGKVEPVVMFMRAASYRPRFDFDGIAQREANQVLVSEFNRAIGESRERLQAQAGGGA